MKSLRNSILSALVTATCGIGCTTDPPKPTPPPPPLPELPPPPITYGRLTLPDTPTKLDIVLSIDNSRSMGDKQQILALAVADLTKSLINPRCVDSNGVPAAVQPGYPTDMCPPGSQREFAPFLDIHIGVTTSSIGGHGADSCPDVDAASKECAPNPNTTNNDHGHLLARIDACGGQEAPTFQNKKFLAWDPTNQFGGETVIDDGNGKGLVPTLRDMVIGTGQIGCGYESQLESIYRFLADPDPYETIAVDNYKAVPMGTDTVLLQQRADFLRPDSMLAIVMLSDENDCSIKEFGQFYYIGQLQNGATPVRLPRARQECSADPNNPCCKSCGQAAGGCPDDPTCKDPNGGTGPALLTAQEDDVNLRCWDQKRRFGIDFLYPTDRYVQAFSSATIADRSGNIVANPIFSDLNPNDPFNDIRDPSMVLVTGIIGVPWQDIARDKNDLKKGYKNASEMNVALDPTGLTTWDVILGNPSFLVKPLDPLMIETTKVRSGSNPITGDPVVDATTPLGNPINGHDWTIPNDDLQYACIFPLLPGTERDCTNTNLSSCDCRNATNDNPLCQPDPNNMNQPTLQVRAKAYPGLRELSVLRDLGSQGIVGSICPAQLFDQSDAATDFGYRPTVSAIVERVKERLGGGTTCLSTSIPANFEGVSQCMLLEARNTQGQGCMCDATKGHRTPATGTDAERFMQQVQKDFASSSEGWDCFCELAQTQGDALFACQQDPSTPPLSQGSPVHGWCYVDPFGSPPIGNPEIVAGCSKEMKRTLRFVGDGAPLSGATVFISCATQ